MRSYKFTYRDRDGEVIGTLDAECPSDRSAIERGLTAKPRVAALIEVLCGKRIVAKRELSGA